MIVAKHGQPQGYKSISNAMLSVELGTWGFSDTGAKTIHLKWYW